MTALEGKLTDMSMVNLIQVFTISRKTGILVLMTGEIKGQIYAQDGQIVNASISDSLTQRVLIEGEKAVYAIMRWRDGNFWFIQKPADSPPYEQRITTRNDALIMDGLRSLDENERAASQIDLDTWVGIAPGDLALGEEEIRIDQRAWRVLNLVYRNVHRVSDLAEQSGLGELRTLATISQMVNSGLLHIDLPPASTPGEGTHPVAPATGSVASGQGSLLARLTGRRAGQVVSS